MRKKSNVLYFRTNRREQRSKGKGKVLAFPAKPSSTIKAPPPGYGQIIFEYRGKRFYLRDCKVKTVDAICSAIDSTKSHAS